MYFKDIKGQDGAIESIRQAIDNNRLPHALLLCGQETNPGLALAHTAAQYIICQHKQNGEPCGKCPECIQVQKCSHPDLHWVYPVVNKNTGGSKEATVSEDMISLWREAYLKNPGITPKQWVRHMAGDEKKQPKIFVSEASSLIKKLSTRPYESDYRIVIFWLPEKMAEDTANKLLKIVEEPYEKTFFLFVSNDPDHIIGTILSRVQRLLLAPPSHEELKLAVNMDEDEDTTFFFENFCSMMRLSYSKKLYEMKAWADNMASIGRERQKNYFQYSQRLVRENYIKNLQHSELNYMNAEEENFSIRFSRFVNDNNVEGIMKELEQAEIDIAQNGNAKMIFFDLALKLIMLLKLGNS
ncbi:MAG: DNA polymerase III subunit delta [Bacteroidales bacterium]|nr:DNA polymerase III subunit delta [Bacteroidales bacterium]